MGSLKLSLPGASKGGRMFDINKAIKRSGLSKKEAAYLEKEIKKDYPHDQMLYELHMIRALKTRVVKPVSRKIVVR